MTRPDRKPISGQMAPSATVDPAEIAKFAALAAEWWDPKGAFAALHRMNPVRLAFIRERAEAHFGPKGARPLNGLSVLDIGCGGGLVSAPLARMGASVLGIDAGEDAVRAAASYAEGAGLTIAFRAVTAEALAAELPGAFDLITALEIVEHVADLGAFLRACEKLLKPGGLLIISTINRTPQARALALFAAEKVLHMAPDGAHEFEKLVKPEDLEDAAPALEWEPPAGISFDPIGRTWRQTHDVSINYLRAALKR